MNTTEGNKLKISTEESDLISVFMFGMKGLFSSNVDWNTLMPVVEKIGKMYDPYKYQAYERREPAFGIVDLTIMNPISEVYDSVTQFIQWYNQSLGKRSEP